MVASRRGSPDSLFVRYAAQGVVEAATGAAASAAVRSGRLVLVDITATRMCYSGVTKLDTLPGLERVEGRVFNGHTCK